MCEEADYAYAHVDENHRKARIGHVCCACKETIRKGDVYRVTRAISKCGSDHSYEHYKHCLRCATMLDAIMEARKGENVAIAWQLDCGEDWKDTIGELPEEVAALAFMSADDAQAKLKETKPTVGHKT